MSPRPIKPQSAPMNPSAWGGWAIVAGATLLVSASTALWAGGALATRAASGAWPQVPWSPVLVVTAAGDVSSVWPAANPLGVWAFTAIISVVVVAVVGVPVMRWGMNRVDSDSAHRALARSSQVEALTLPSRRAQVKRLRPTLRAVKTRQIPAAEAGVAIGTLHTGSKRSGPLLLAGWEDVACAIMAPRSGKTTAVAIPAILSAPGPVVATSNKADLLITADVRAQRTGARVHVFDPQQLAHTPQGLWWNPLAGITTVEAAERLAGHFLATMPGEKQRIWGQSATELLGGLILAAALDGQPLPQVYEWLVNEHATAPPVILTGHGFTEVAASLKGMGRLAEETRSSVYFTARAATACLRNPQIMAWVTPTAGVDEFAPDRFIGTRETLYLLSKDSGGSAAPLVAALADAVIRAGIRAAEAQGGRVDPPVTVILDEAASVAPISDLPVLVSHAGSRAIFICTILQSFPQGEAVWRDGGMKALWSASTIKLIGPGQDDATFNESVSKLLGEQWVTTTSYSSGSGPKGSSVSTNVTRQRVMDAAAVRGIPKGTAVLIATGAPAAMVRLLPWYDGGDARELAAAEARLAGNIADAARATTGGPS